MQRFLQQILVSFLRTDTGVHAQGQASCGNSHRCIEIHEFSLISDPDWWFQTRVDCTSLLWSSSIPKYWLYITWHILSYQIISLQFFCFFGGVAKDCLSIDQNGTSMFTNNIQQPTARIQDIQGAGGWTIRCVRQPISTSPKSWQRRDPRSGRTHFGQKLRGFEGWCFLWLKNATKYNIVL